jgi:hypothetical protein
MKRRATRLCLLLIIASLAGCNLPPLHVWVYIDNSGDQPMTVRVDGGEAVTIEPGQFAELKYPPGEHRFTIDCGGETLCDLTRNLEPSDRVGEARKYLFDPQKNHRYQKYEAKYGVSRLGNIMESSLLGFQKDPAIRRQYIYKQLLKEVELVPTDAWNDVTGTQYVLVPPPESVTTRSGTARRTVLDRIDPSNYERLSRAAEETNPSEQEIDSLNELLNDVFSETF